MRLATSLLSASLLIAPFAQAAPRIEAPAPQAALSYMVKPAQEPKLAPVQMTALLRRHIRYVFVLYQENRSFDSYFGTFPGADGLYSRPAGATPGLTQPIVGVSGRTETISPFRIGPTQYAADTDDIDHSHPAMFAKMHDEDGHARMDRFALIEEKRYWKSGAHPSLMAKQMGELAMAYEDCDTIPLLWRYADRFVLMDHMFQDMIGPSTPGNLSIFAAQTGLTQWALHPDEAWKTATAPGDPVVADQDPLWGSPADPYKNKIVPYNPKDYRKDKPRDIQINQTYASLALTTAGGTVKAETAQDKDPKSDLADVEDDLGFIQHLDRNKVAWRWFQEGYSLQPVPGDQGPRDAAGIHASYITHHNGPQYFGYIANNPAMAGNMQGLQTFFQAVKAGSLPGEGGVFFVKGGYINEFGMKPADPDAAVQKRFRGDDDHPAYSDSQISESLIARAVNAIAASKYWPHAAIMITWDDSEGDYDHVPPPELARAPDGTRLSDGPRVPFIVVSPFARVHNVSHAVGNQASVVKFVDTVFDLPPLAILPDEEVGRRAGMQKFHQALMGPFDADTPYVANLFSAFDPARLDGKAPPLPAAYAEVPKPWVNELPAQSGADCKAVGIVPTDLQLHVTNRIPKDFNPRPKTDPGRMK